MERDKQGFFKETSILAEDYVRERLLLLKLQTVEKTARLVSVVFTGFIIFLFGFFILLFLSIMAIYFLEQLTGSWYFGLGIVSGFYGLLLTLIIFVRKTLIYNIVADVVIRIFFEKTEDINEEQ